MKTFSIIAAIVLIAANQPTNGTHLQGGAGTHEAPRPAPCRSCECDAERVEGQMQFLASELGKAVERIKALEAENAAMKAANREPEYRIVMYGFQGCGYCDQLKNILKAAGIEYDYIDIGDDEKESWRSLGITGFPTTFLVEDNVLQANRRITGLVSAATVRQSYPEVFQ